MEVKGNEALKLLKCNLFILCTVLINIIFIMLLYKVICTSI